MFEVDFRLAVTLYLGLIVFIISIFWMLSGRKKKTIGLRGSEKEFIWQCEICAYTYVDSKNVSISSCPRCGSYNERKKTVEETQK